eukprot:6027146-Amphidinium_carterae.1
MVHDTDRSAPHHQGVLEMGCSSGGQLNTIRCARSTGPSWQYILCTRTLGQPFREHESHPGRF